MHQLSYALDFASANMRAMPASAIRACSLPKLTSANATQTNPLIPNVIHQIWKTQDVSTYPVEASRQAWLSSFEPFNYTVRLWTDDDILMLIKSNYSWLLSTYESYPQNIQRADIARLVVVHAQGGIYADLDVYPGSIKDMICLQQLGLPAVLAPMSGNIGLSNHFIMATRGSVFLQSALEEAKRRSDASRRCMLPYLQVFWSTGPLMMTWALQQYARLYETTEYEVGVMDEGYGQLVLQHLPGRSWHGLDGHVLNWIGDDMTTGTRWLLMVLGASMGALLLIMVRRHSYVLSKDE